MPILKPPRGTQLNLTHPLSRGLVGCWLMNEGCGGTIFDSSRNGNTGTLATGTAAPTWVPGPRGTCLSFDGGDYINCGSPILCSPITFVVWINPSIITGNYISIAYGPDASSYIQVWNYYIRFSINNSLLTTYPITAANVRYSVIGTYDKSLGSSNMKLYVDGILRDKKDSTTEINTGSLTIGAYKYSGSYIFGFNGLIDTLLIYNRALSAAEIAQLYQKPFCMFEE